MLKIYERGEHKGGFIGVRVAVMIDGKHKQKYFSYSSFGVHNGCDPSLM